VHWSWVGKHIYWLSYHSYIKVWRTDGPAVLRLPWKPQKTVWFFAQNWNGKPSSLSSYWPVFYSKLLGLCGFKKVFHQKHRSGNDFTIHTATSMKRSQRGYSGPGAYILPVLFISFGSLQIRISSHFHFRSVSPNTPVASSRPSSHVLCLRFGMPLLYNLIYSSPQT
jgi:hypothetical protein